MPCNHPLTAFLTGNKTDKGADEYVIGHEGDKVFNAADLEKRGLTFNPSAPHTFWQGHCYLVDPIPIPCGHCVGCRMDRAKEWKVRCCLESLSWKNSWFVTLTYDDRHLPCDTNGVPVLVKKDLQDFLKRIRYYSKGKLRFFACGEYGEIGKRPHYHLILFCDVLTATCRYEDGQVLWSCKELNDAWTFGLTDIRPADPGSMAYVCGYVEKKQSNPDYPGYPVKPFILMSRRPGLGLDQLKRFSLLKTGRVYGDFGGIRSASAPRLFLNKVRDDLLFDDLKALRVFAGKAANTANVAYFNKTDFGFDLDDIKNEELQQKRISKI